MAVAQTKRRTKEYEELGFSDDFMFGKMLEDDERCRKLLELLLNRRVGKLKNVIAQKMMKQTKEGKAIRMDIYTEEKRRRVVYDAEMQNLNGQTPELLELPKRSRFYQSEMDAEYLAEKGKYSDLPENNIVFICTFDPYGFGRAIYHFENRTDGEPVVRLGDGTHKYFFNCTYEGEDIPEKLQNFFRFVMKGEANDEFTEELEMAMKKAKQNREWRFEYLREQAVLDDQYNQGVEAGRSLEREKTKQERKKAKLEKKRADELEKENQKLREELAKRDKKG